MLRPHRARSGIPFGRALALLVALLLTSSACSGPADTGSPSEEAGRADSGSDSGSGFDSGADQCSFDVSAMEEALSEMPHFFEGDGGVPGAESCLFDWDPEWITGDLGLPESAYPGAAYTVGIGDGFALNEPTGQLTVGGTEVDIARIDAETTTASAAAEDGRIVLVEMYMPIGSGLETPDQAMAETVAAVLNNS